MGEETPSNKSWFKLLLSGVFCVGILLPVPEPLDLILVLLAGVPLMIESAVDIWGFFAREHAEYLADRDRYL